MKFLDKIKQVLNKNLYGIGVKDIIIMLLFILVGVGLLFAGRSEKSTNLLFVVISIFGISAATISIVIIRYIKNKRNKK